nr:hypothetical protein Iba_chr01bCG9370 [Ipomoea batatas]GMC89342.1 hypothetical protein Iba_scaffold36638CG0070 [Ipomoea batatas]GMD34564.1 hypothetical protein Iba_scaffold44208CG0010 [Ipomoea batatas]GME19230.1 hypothetical protein Iba_scaffold22218CG0010 [Ipomoea batatas]
MDCDEDNEDYNEHPLQRREGDRGFEAGVLRVVPGVVQLDLRQNQLPVLLPTEVPLRPAWVREGGAIVSFEEFIRELFAETPPILRVDVLDRVARVIDGLL